MPAKHQPPTATLPISLTLIPRTVLDRIAARSAESGKSTAEVIADLIHTGMNLPTPPTPKAA